MMIPSVLKHWRGKAQFSKHACAICGNASGLTFDFAATLSMYGVQGTHSHRDCIRKLAMEFKSNGNAAEGKGNDQR
jgi:hypothetical protein